jgi:hypothetical protein
MVAGIPPSGRPPCYGQAPIMVSLLEGSSDRDGSAPTVKKPILRHENLPLNLCSAFSSTPFQVSERTDIAVEWTKPSDCH